MEKTVEQRAAEIFSNNQGEDHRSYDPGWQEGYLVGAQLASPWAQEQLERRLGLWCDQDMVRDGLAVGRAVHRLRVTAWQSSKR